MKKIHLILFFLISFGNLSAQTVIFDGPIYFLQYGSGAGSHNSVANIKLDKFSWVYLTQNTNFGVPMNCCTNKVIKINPWTESSIMAGAGIASYDTPYINYKHSLYFWDIETDIFQRRTTSYLVIPFAPGFESKVFVDKNDYLFISNGDSIYKLDSTGVIVSAFDIDVEYIAGDELDHLYIVTDSLRKYDYSGTVLWSYPNNGNEILVDSIGNTYFYDSGSFTKINSSGNTEFIRTGLPSGLIAVDRLYNIYIASTNQLYKYNSTADTLIWSYPLSEIYTAMSVDSLQNCYLARGTNLLNNNRVYLKVISSLPPPDSILITQVSDSIFCSGDSIEVYFDVIGNQHYGSYYKLELSSASGLFNVGGNSVLGDGVSSPIKGVLSPLITSSSNYAIRVVPSLYPAGINSQPFPITINKPQTITFSVPAFHHVCSNYPPVDIGPQPPGGLLTGQGIYGTTFYPDSVTFPGNYIINYSIVDSNGCNATSDVYISALINPISSVSLVTTADSICKGDTLHLSGFPTGGYYSGSGVTGNKFYSDSTSLTDNLVKYSKATVTYGKLCVTSTSKILHVFPPDSILFSIPKDSVCPTEIPFLLSASPVGGVFSGNAVSGQTFYPDSAIWLANNLIHYNYTDSLGCAQNATDSVYVSEVPVVSIIPSTDTLCHDESVILSGIPAGGIYSGQGMTDSIFIALNGIEGINSLTYTYSNSVGCENSANANMYVLPVVEIDFNLSQDTVCLNTSPFVINVSPPGGILAGNGLYGNVFYPDSAGTGLSTITYSFQANDGCIYPSTHNIYVDYCLSSPLPPDNSEAITFYPNPASNLVTIKSPVTLDEATIQIFDSGGHLIYSGKYKDSIVNINVSLFAEGLYLCKIFNNTQLIFNEMFSVIRRHN
jgi:hypothetical protein